MFFKPPCKKEKLSRRFFIKAGSFLAEQRRCRLISVLSDYTRYANRHIYGHNQTEVVQTAVKTPLAGIIARVHTSNPGPVPE